MKKDFDRWNEIKKMTDAYSINFYFKEQEVWWVKTGLNIGIESNGKGQEFTRPVLIIKKHNRHSCLTVSLTTSSKLDRSKTYLDTDRHPGIFVKLSQIKTLDSRRLSSKMFFLDKSNFDRIKDQIKNFNGL